MIYLDAGIVMRLVEGGQARFVRLSSGALERFPTPSGFW